MRKREDEERESVCVNEIRNIDPVDFWIGLIRQERPAATSPQSAIKPSVSIAMIGTTSHRIPVSASTNQGPHGGGPDRLAVGCQSTNMQLE